MQATRWLIATLAMTAAAGGAVVAMSVAVDIYGLYHGGVRRERVVYGDPRFAKYLLNQRYVPENFDAILVGPSLSANWDLTGIEKLRVYNDSLNGANSVEAEAIVAAALARPGIQAAFVIVHPALTFTHDFKTVRLSPELKRSALGSASLWEAYVDMLNIAIGRSRQRFDSAGKEEPEFIATKMNENMKRLWNGDGEFEVDATAMDAYRRMIANLRAHGAQVVFVVPPTAEDLLERKRAAFDRYTRMARSELSRGEDWIDFTSAEHKEFRSDPASFTDGVHFSATAAKYVVAELNTRVNESMSKGTLRKLAARSGRPF